jgi:hypothetical protein
MQLKTKAFFEEKEKERKRLLTVQPYYQPEETIHRLDGHDEELS